MMNDPQSFEQAFTIAKREECNENLIRAESNPVSVNVVASDNNILQKC